jgi:hypothetical protein
VRARPRPAREIRSTPTVVRGRSQSHSLPWKEAITADVTRPDALAGCVRASPPWPGAEPPSLTGRLPSQRHLGRCPRAERAMTLRTDSDPPGHSEYLSNHLPSRVDDRGGSSRPPVSGEKGPEAGQIHSTSGTHADDRMPTQRVRIVHSTEAPGAEFRRANFRVSGTCPWYPRSQLHELGLRGLCVASQLLQGSVCHLDSLERNPRRPCLHFVGGNEVFFTPLELWAWSVVSQTRGRSWALSRLFQQNPRRPACIGFVGINSPIADWL